MKVAAEWSGVGMVFLAVDRSYARPQYYWSTEFRNAEVYPDGDPVKKVRSKKLRDQVTDIQAIDRSLTTTRR